MSDELSHQNNVMIGNGNKADPFGSKARTKQDMRRNCMNQYLNSVWNA